MQIQTAEFVITSVDPEKCPEATIPEYAFIGRSNVGKSSLINAIANNHKLAKTSGTPGKTQAINHFIMNNTWYLVDLPGYGYAKVSKKDRATWNNFTKNYMRNRENLMCVFILLDARLEPQKIDLEFMEWMGTNRIPFVMVFTKTDKLSSSQWSKNLVNYKKEMLKKWDSLPQIIATSSVNRQGLDQILDLVEKTNALY